MFVDPDRRVVTIHERAAEGFWGERQLTGGHLELAGTASTVRIDVGDLWQQVEQEVTRA